MARNGSGVYSLPAGSTVTNGDTSDATDLNTPLQDIEADLNTPRPVVAGGTGASSASAARTNLGIGNVGLNFIATLDASASSTLVFTDFDSATYDGYVFVLGNIIPSADATLGVQTSTDGGSSYDAGASDYKDGSTSRNYIPVSVGGVSNTGSGVSGTVTVSHPHLTKNTFVLPHTVAVTSSGNVETETAGGMRVSSADVDAVRFFFTGGANITSGAITMYGYRNA